MQVGFRNNINVSASLVVDDALPLLPGEHFMGGRAGQQGRERQRDRQRDERIHDAQSPHTVSSCGVNPSGFVLYNSFPVATRYASMRSLSVIT